MGMGSEGVIILYAYGAVALIVIFLVSLVVWFMVMRKKYRLPLGGSIFASLALGVLTTGVIFIVLWSLLMGVLAL